MKTKFSVRKVRNLRPNCAVVNCYISNPNKRPGITMLDVLLTFVSANVWTLVIATVTLITAGYLVTQRRTNKGNYPPGPKGVPLYGNLLDIKRSDVNGPGIFDKWADEFGNVYSLRFGPYDVVVLNTPDVIREAFLNHGDTTSGRPVNVFFIGKIIGKSGIIFNDGQRWKDIRRTALHSLRDSGMGKKSMEERIQEEGRALVGAIDLKDGQPFDPRRMFHNAVSNVITSIIFGERYDYNDPEFQSLAEDLAFFVAHGGFKNPEMFVPILTPLLPILNPSFFRASKCIFGLRNFIRRKVKQQMTSFDPDNIQCFIDIYLSAMQNKEFSDKGQEDIMDSVYDVYVAGSETTTTSLLWTLLYFVHYPQVQEKCQRGIEEVIGQIRPPSNTDRQHLPYIEATMYEIQRIGSIAANGLLHRTLEDVVISGYTIPKDTILSSNLYHVHMDRDYWGDPEVFRPDRWLGEDGKLIKHDYFMPFSTGPRECLGKALALQELFIILVSLLQKFTFTATDPDHLPRLGGAMGVTYGPESYHIIARRN